jgi:hypothetical protein
MMEAASASETLVNFYQTTWHYNPADSHLHTHHCENLKFYLKGKCLRRDQNQNGNNRFGKISHRRKKEHWKKMRRRSCVKDK